MREHAFFLGRSASKRRRFCWNGGRAFGAANTWHTSLPRHRCIRHRVPSGWLYRWEFSKRGQEIAVEVPGALMLDDNQLMVLAAANGLGIAYVLEVFARSQLPPSPITMEPLNNGRFVFCRGVLWCGGA